MKWFQNIYRKLAVFGTAAVLFSIISVYPFHDGWHLLNSFTPRAVLAELLPGLTVTSPTSGQRLGTQSVPVNGTADANAVVDIYIDGVTGGTTTADANGSWTFTTETLAEGDHTVYAMNGALVSETVAFSVDLTPPEVTITSPLDGTFTNTQTIEGQSEPGAQVTVYVYGTEATVTTDPLGNWSYSDPTLPDGSYTVNAVAADSAGNQSTAAVSSFVMDITRPIILPELFPPDDMTQVPLDTVTSVYLIDSSPIQPLTLNNALTLVEKGNVAGQVYGTVYSSVYSDVYGDPYYQISFMPELPLKPAMKYQVSVSPMIADTAGNFVYARTWSFSTVAGDVYENPHGNYLANTNVCVNCHTPHNAAAPKLVEPRDVQFVTVDDYCNACHDGTVAPPPENWQAANRHDHKITAEGTVGPSACTSCHNPHLTWTPENPNFLQDFFSYEHNDPTNPFLPNSSEQEMCNTCHEPAITDDPRVQYITYQYNKWHSSSGTLGDYGLCLQCHDGVRATNIRDLYTVKSGHNIKAADGSYLDGAMPCADCHNTHGSPNPKNLKTEIGQSSPRSFIMTEMVWDPATERRFCQSCHNNNTAVYGIVAGFVYDIPGHEENSTEFCYSCHGGSPIQAAHAPTVPY